MDISKLKPLENGSGSFGRCYIVDKDTLYKKFSLNDEGVYPFVRDDFNNLFDIDNDTFIFPYKLDVCNEYVKGVFMKWIHAPNMALLDYDISFSKVILALEKFKKDLRLISEKNIIVSDISEENVLFDDNFYVVDTDLYFIDKNVSDVYIFNENYFVSFLEDYFIGSNFSFEFLYLLKNNKIFNKAFIDMSRSKKICYFQEFLDRYKEKISEFANYEIDNLKNTHKVLLRECVK